MNRKEFKENFLINAFYWITKDNYLALQLILQEFGIICHTGDGVIEWHNGFTNIATFPPDNFHNFEYYQKSMFIPNTRFGEPKNFTEMFNAYTEIVS